MANATSGQATSGTSAGDDNRALAVLLGKASASNGGTATSNASGAAVNSGDNTGNQVQIGS